MVRSLLGRLVEWALSYERRIVVSGPGACPRRAHRDDAGYDLQVSRDTWCRSGVVTEIPTGVYLDPRSRVWFEIKSRSSTFRRHGLEVQDAIIDNGYRGEMFAIVYNPSESVVVRTGERICQIVPHLLLPCRFRFGSLRGSTRGARGFGSTG